jgi:peptidoglycan/xylan/chitin deacetylase (PgdA/CDA1 family)
MRLVRPAVKAAVTGAVLVLASGVRAQAQTAPVSVRNASLTQQGQDLVWSVRFNSPVYPEALQRQHVSVCLLIKSPSGAIRRSVCVAPGPHGHPPPRLTVGGRSIAATVSLTRHTDLQAAFLPSAIGMGYARLRWQVQIGASLFPGRGQLLRLHIPQLVGCAPTGPPYVFHGPTTGRMIALTFDDGPWYDTPQFLDVLEREHVVATFFQIGRQIAQYGSVDRRMLRDGDMIGDHTWNHANVSGGGSFAAGEISMTASAIKQATGGFSPCLFRAPGGAVSPALISVASRMGFTTIQWDVDPRDWSLPGTGAIYSNVIANARPGAIVIQHDGGGNRLETLAALPHEIDTLRREGYHFVTVTQLLGYRLLYK